MRYLFLVYLSWMLEKKIIGLKDKVGQQCDLAQQTGKSALRWQINANQLALTFSTAMNVQYLSSPQTGGRYNMMKTCLKTGLSGGNVFWSYSCRSSRSSWWTICPKLITQLPRRTCPTSTATCCRSARKAPTWTLTWVRDAKRVYRQKWNKIATKKS